MKYKVTFYKNSLELLTERKANFVNKIKSLTSKVFDELAKKTNKTGKTSAISILEQLRDLTYYEKPTWRVGITLDDYRYLQIPSLPQSGEPIPFKFKFNLNRSFRDFPEYDIKGHVHPKTINGTWYISEIYLEIDTYIPDNFDPQKNVRHFINIFQGALTHEIAHAQDEFLKNEISNYKQAPKKNENEIKFFEYWLNPTEIRSHMIEMIQVINSNRYSNPNRTFKNMYKTAAKAEELGIKHTQEQKDRTKKVYGMLKKSYDDKKIDEISKDALMTVINRAYHGTCPKLAKQFIYDYHISFIKESSPTMKQRFYDKYFPNTPTQPLKKMQDFFESMKNVNKGFEKLKREVEKRYRSYGRDVNSEIIQMIQEFNSTYLNLWESNELSPSFENYNPKLLKKLGKQMIETFREKHGFMTKGMMTKAAKAYTKQIEKEYREKYGSGAEGMEDFFNSDPSTVRR